MGKKKKKKRKAPDRSWKEKPWKTRSSPLDAKDHRKVYGDEDKKNILSYAIARKLETPRISITKIAHELEMPERTLNGLLRNEKKWGEYMREQKALFDAQAVEAIQSGIKRIKNTIGKASLTQATISVGVLHDKIFGGEPIAQVNVGDNRQIKVFYPNFKPSE